MTDLQTVLTHGLSSRGQVVRLRVHIVDKPGELGHISDLIAGHGANIHDVQHVRSHPDLDVGDAYLQFRIETSGASQTERIVDAITGDGYSVRRMN